MPTSNRALDNDCLIQPRRFSVAICKLFGTKRDDNKHIGFCNFACAVLGGVVGGVHSALKCNIDEIN